jgi:hypothetical protein
MARETDERTPRELESRSNEQRTKTWAPPTVLPEPKHQDGFSYRWVRTAAFGKADNTNVSSKFREGWEPVKAKDHPELQMLTDPDSRFPDNVEVGGLLLCRTASENMRSKHDSSRTGWIRTTCVKMILVCLFSVRIRRRGLISVSDSRLPTTQIGAK